MAFTLASSERSCAELFEWEKLSKLENVSPSESSNDKRQDEETVRKTYACYCQII